MSVVSVFSKYKGVEKIQCVRQWNRFLLLCCENKSRMNVCELWLIDYDELEEFGFIPVPRYI